MDVEPASATAQLLRLNSEFLEVLRASGVVIVVIGPRWFAGLSDSNDVAREEVAIALGYEAVRVIPLVVGGASLPSPDELPADLRPLLERSALWLPESEFEGEGGGIVLTLLQAIRAATSADFSARAPRGRAADPFEVVEVLTVEHEGQPRPIELCFGDLAALPSAHAVDVVVISARPDSYYPTRHSLIRDLEQRQGISVEELARHKAVDLRATCSCWMSQEIVRDPSPGFRRLLCFEPHRRGEPAAMVGDIFRSLVPFVEGSGMRTVAMPVVSAGGAGVPVAEMLPPLIEAAVKWMTLGLAIERLKIVIHSERQRPAATTIFRSMKEQYAASTAPPRGASKYDFFLSYAHADGADVETLEAELLRLDSKLRIFRDRRELAPGVAWQHQLFSALDACRRVVALYSPDYIRSKVCQEEFNIAWVRNRESEEPVLIPIYLYTAKLPGYMTLPQHLDCREGDVEKLRSACELLVDASRRVGK
jgi:hypothetical protein